ncbi:MAG TPA: LolA-related protein [Gammaproteobacteria bacterium]
MRHRTTTPARAALLVLLLTATSATGAPDSAELIARLAREPPTTVAFVEVRFSSLLVEPLVVGGELDYESGKTLRRRVETPYRETTTISGDTVRVERDGESRTLALRRAPELRGLLMGMVGLLGGDAAFLNQHFAITAIGDEATWQLDLAPTDDRVRQRLRAITATGIAVEPRCFVIHDTQGGASVMLLGAAAARSLPQPVALAELLASCSAE